MKKDSIDNENDLQSHIMLFIMRAGNNLFNGCLIMRIFMLATILVGLWSGGVKAADELNIYSHRQQFLLQPFLDSFTEATGIQTNVVFAAKGLAQRLAAEGKASPADLVLTVDISRLSEYAEMDLFQPVQSDILNKSIPAHLRGEGNIWFGLSKRARIIAVSKERVSADEISRIEDLADPKWKGRICTRKGSHVYNRALLASLVAHHGEAEAQKWAEALVGNLARRPQGNDRAQAKAIFSGECDVAIMNHYYYGKMLTSDEVEQRDWADAITLIFPNQEDRGAHINISGGGVAKYAPNKDNAIAFLEFLVSDEAQRLYGDINFEYAVTDTAPLSKSLTQWGTIKGDDLPIEALAEHAKTAQMIIDRVGW